MWQTHSRFGDVDERTAQKALFSLLSLITWSLSHSTSSQLHIESEVLGSLHDPAITQAPGCDTVTAVSSVSKSGTVMSSIDSSFASTAVDPI